MSHLSADELRRWHDAPEESNRARVIGHLASCDKCGSVLAELVRARPLEASAYAVADELTRRRGYTAAERPRVRFRPVLMAAGVAVLAAALAFLLAGGPRATTPDAAALRGTEMRPLEPAGEVSWPFTFRWTSPVSAPSYRLDVYDAAGDLVHSVQTGEQTAADPALGAVFRAGHRYAWEVTALGADGAPILTSERRAFVVVSRAP